MIARTSRHVAVSVAVLAGTACSDPAPPEPEVASIELSVPVTGTSIRFRDPLIVRATPQAALGVPLEREVTWVSITPALLSVQPLAADGDSARIRAAGVGTGQIRVSTGSVSQTFDVTVQDTVFSVTLSPAALSLVAGDTATFTAVVNRPPSSDPTIRWDISDANVLHAVQSPDSLVLHVQATGGGVSRVRAMSVADTTKNASSTVSVQVGRLSFFAEPTTTPREVPFTPRVSVVVHDAAGNVSQRTANDITMSVTPSSCGAMMGAVTVRTAGGLAEFSDLRMSTRCSTARLTATSVPAATSVTSQSFNVIERNCAVSAPLGFNQAVQATIENVDCTVSRNDVPFYSHAYELTVPGTVPSYLLELDVPTAAFAPRIAAALWQDTTATWTDSLPGQPPWYVLGPGTYRFRVMSPAPSVGPYTLSVGQGNFFTGAGPCRIAASVSFSSNVNIGPCPIPFASRTGQGAGRVFVLYLPAGKSITITNRLIDNNTRDAYLEVLDITSPSALPVVVASDDNSGGGALGRDAQLTVNQAPAGRFLEVRATLYGPGTGLYFNVTISP